LSGQCYNGAGNIRDKYVGMATLIQGVCKKAIYVWCHAHRLVMNRVMACCLHIRNMLGILEELHRPTCMNAWSQAKWRVSFSAGPWSQKTTETCFNDQVEQHRGSCWHVVMSRYKELVLDALNWTVRVSVQQRTITAVVGLKKRLKDFRVVLSMEILQAVIIVSLGQLLGCFNWWVCWPSYTASTLLDDFRTNFHDLRRNPV